MTALADISEQATKTPEITQDLTNATSMSVSPMSMSHLSSIPPLDIGSPYLSVEEAAGFIEPETDLVILHWLARAAESGVIVRAVLASPFRRLGASCRRNVRSLLPTSLRRRRSTTFQRAPRHTRDPLDECSLLRELCCCGPLERIFGDVGEYELEEEDIELALFEADRGTIQPLLSDMDASRRV